MTKIRAYLSIRGDFTPDSLTRILKINPTHFHIKGDIIPPFNDENKVRYWSYTAWEYSTEEIETQISDDATDIIFEKFKGKTDLLADFVKKYDLHVVLQFVVEVDVTPAITFSSEVVEFLGKIEARIDVDMYIDLGEGSGSD